MLTASKNFKALVLTNPDNWLAFVNWTRTKIGEELECWGFEDVIDLALNGGVQLETPFQLVEAVNDWLCEEVIQELFDEAAEANLSVLEYLENWNN